MGHRSWQWGQLDLVDWGFQHSHFNLRQPFATHRQNHREGFKKNWTLNFDQTFKTHSPLWNAMNVHTVSEIYLVKFKQFPFCQNKQRERERDPGWLMTSKNVDLKNEK